ncbi:MAG: transglutaminase family protein [Firmicutes bacterium]|nr:transglutaminase family protein [Bacillota bacterium]
MENLLNETALLNFNHPTIRTLVEKKGWHGLIEKDRVLAIYNFVRDDIIFGYNRSDDITAAAVLKDGYGQCNTKGILFMALLRAVGIPCRIHGFYIDKIMQKGALKGFYYKRAPKEILHSWVEIFYKDAWLNLEGFILDMNYLVKLQRKFKNCSGPFCGYGVAIENFKNPPVKWNESDTYIQKDKIVKDLGIYDSPDDLLAIHQQKIGRFKNFVFKLIVRHLMNKNIKKIRNAK